MKIKSQNTKKRNRDSLVFDLEQIVERDGQYVHERVRESKGGAIQQLPKTIDGFYITSVNLNKKRKKSSINFDETEILLKNAATRLLRREGWVVNTNLTSFRMNKTALKDVVIGRHQMSSIMNRIQPVLALYGNSAIDGTISEPVLETAVMEDFLVSRKLRLVELEDCVKSSCEDPKETSDAYNSNQIQINSSITNNDENENTATCIKITQKLPSSVIDTEIIDNIEYQVLSKYFDSSSDKKTLLSMKLIDIKDDTFSVALEIKGLEQLVEDARQLTLKKIKGVIASHNVNSLLNDSKSYEVDVRLDASKKDIGMKVCAPSDAKMKINAGLWITSVTPLSQVNLALGSGTSKGAVLLKIKLHKKPWQDVYTVKDKNILLKEAQQEKNKSILARFCLSKDISDEDLNHIKSKGLDIWRRDGNVIANNRKKPKEDSKQKQDASLKKRNSMNSHVTTQLKSNKRNTSRQLFLEKMKGVIEIEFKNYKINQKHINETMWKAHNELYGTECDERCLCPSNIGQLTKNVIRDYLEVEQKKKSWKNIFNLHPNDSMVGFATNFCSKFYNKVNKQYPSDLPHVTLQRLLAMWKEHTKQLRFGLKCEETCTCGDSFDALFLPACNLDVMENRKQKQNNNSTYDSSVLPNDSKESSNAKKSKTSDVVVIEPSKISVGACFTNKHGKCVVASIDPRGNLKKKINNITLGSIVTGASKDDNEMQPINSYNELENMYNILKQEAKRKMKIWFSIKDDNNSNGSDQTNYEWTHNGGWLGDLQGWPGGAPKARNAKNHGTFTKLGGTSAKTIVDSKSSEQSVKSTCNLLNPTNSLDDQDALQSARNIERQHEEMVCKSIIKHRNDKKSHSKGNVRIDTSKNQIHAYYSNQTQKKINIEECASLETALSPKQPIAKFVQFVKQRQRNKEFYKSLSSKLQSQIDIHQYHSDEAENQGEYDNTENCINVLKQKRTLLKILEIAGEVIDMSRNFRDGVLLQLSPSHINITDSFIEQDQNIEDKLYCSLLLNGTVQATTPTVPFDTRIIWPSFNKFSTLCGKARVSEFYGEEIAEIQLCKGSPTTTEHEEVGKIAIPVHDVISRLRSEAPTESVSYQLISSSNTNVGSVTVSFDIATASDEVIEQKRTIILKKIEKLVIAMKTFRLHNPKESNTISADISNSSDGRSLLHVAVSCCDVKILQELIKLGANKQSFSKEEDIPIEYARELVKKRDSNRFKYHEIIQVLDSPVSRR